MHQLQHSLILHPSQCQGQHLRNIEFGFQLQKSTPEKPTKLEAGWKGDSVLGYRIMFRFQLLVCRGTIAGWRCCLWIHPQLKRNSFAWILWISTTFKGAWCCGMIGYMYKGSPLPPKNPIPPGWVKPSGWVKLRGEDRKILMLHERCKGLGRFFSALRRLGDVVNYPGPRGFHGSDWQKWTRQMPGFSLAERFWRLYLSSWWLNNPSETILVKMIIFPK